MTKHNQVVFDPKKLIRLPTLSFPFNVKLENRCVRKLIYCLGGQHKLILDAVMNDMYKSVSIEIANEMIFGTNPHWKDK